MMMMMMMTNIGMKHGPTQDTHRGRLTRIWVEDNWRDRVRASRLRASAIITIVKEAGKGGLPRRR